MRNFILPVILFLLVNLTGFAQSGADPSIRARPLPVLNGLGTVFSLTFTIGNEGYAPISGVRLLNKMAFGICLSKCAPTTVNPLDALSGELLNYFDITYNLPPGTGQGGCYEGIQKSGVEVPATSVFNLYINAVVTTASNNTVTNDIGASGNVQPNPTAIPEPSDNNSVVVFTHTINAPQPVSLIAFTANVRSDRTVLINWSTSWERDNKGYIIERSKDLKNFESVGEVRDVAGDQRGITNYHLSDANPYQGTSYYRLKQIDLDGTVHVYPAESVVLRDDVYGIFPNPVVSKQFQVVLDEPQTAQLTFHNVLGQPVPFQTKANGDGGLNVSSTNNLLTGVYVLTVQERGQIRRYRVLIQ